MGDPLKPPAFIQLDQNALQATARGADQSAYAASDADYAKRFPEMVAARDASINDAAGQLSGQQDPAITGALGTAGLGNVNFGNTEFKQAQNLGQPILAKEQRDRNYFDTLLSQNPARSIGLSSSDVAHIALANTGNKTAFDTALFGSDINQANADAQASAQNSAAIASGVGSAIQSALKFSGAGGTNSPYGPANQAAYSAPTNYLNPSTYNYTPSGGYYDPGFAPSSYGGTFEGQINGNDVYRAEPVGSTYTSPADSGSGTGASTSF